MPPSSPPVRGRYYYDYQAIFAYSTLALGTHFTLDALTPTVLTAQTLANAGSLNASGSGGGLFLDTATVINTGLISAGSGDIIGIAVNSQGNALTQTLSLSSPGVVHSGGGNAAFALNLVSGATLELGGIASTGQLLGLLGSVTGVAVDLLGTITNTGTSLVSSKGGVLGNLLLDNAEIIGGTLADTGGTLFVESGTFSGVTFAGPLQLETGSDLSIVGGLSLTGTAGTGLGTIDPIGSSGTLTFLDNETLTNVLINDTANLSLLTAPTVPTLTLGASATFAVSDALTIAATTLVNAGTILAPGVGGLVDLGAGTVFNSGTIAIGAGATLALDFGGSDFYSFGPLSDPLDLVNTGSISIAAGGTLLLGSTESAAQLLGLPFLAPGVQVDLLGTLINSGPAVTVGSTELTNLLLDADVLGGTIANTGGTLLVSGGTLNGVTFQGPLDLANETQLAVSGGLALAGANGTGIGTINAGGFGDALIFQDAETLANVFVNGLTAGISLIADTPILALAASATLSDGSAPPSWAPPSPMPAPSSPAAPRPAELRDRHHLQQRHHRGRGRRHAGARRFVLCRARRPARPGQHGIAEHRRRGHADHRQHRNYPAADRIARQHRPQRRCGRAARHPDQHRHGAHHRQHRSAQQCLPRMPT